MDDMDAIYRSHAQTVYKFLLAQCHDPDLAEELTQETFYQAVRSIGRFDGLPSTCGISICENTRRNRPLWSRCWNPPLPQRKTDFWSRRDG